MSARSVLAILLLASAVSGGAAAAATPPSPEPYAASFAYAQCLRAHGVPHPYPDAQGDFSLTPAQEARLRATPSATKKKAEDACFHHLKGLNLRPLSAKALAQSTAVVTDLTRCYRAHGYQVGKPAVKNLPRGKAFFGFEGRRRPNWTKEDWRRFNKVGLACEQTIHMAARLDKIIAADRDTGRPDL